MKMLVPHHATAPKSLNIYQKEPNNHQAVIRQRPLQRLGSHGARINDLPPPLGSYLWSECRKYRSQV
jgi:hypothetical protein